MRTSTRLSILRAALLTGLILVVAGLLIPHTQIQARTSPPMKAPSHKLDPRWTLVWSDEFDGTTVDPNKWTFEIGAGGWGNNELEFYTGRPENARPENGNLVIETRHEPFGIRGAQYTSARLKTQGIKAWTTGRFEARIKIPYGQGIWPAFWMLGTSASWPTGGEIDIMENIGKEPNIVHGSLHGPSYSSTEIFTLPKGNFSDDFHVFAVEWEADHITWFVDDQPYFTQMAKDIKGTWVFNRPDFYLLLNVAVGGGWPGNPDDTTKFPQFMYVDYVRVYQTGVF